MELMNLQPHNAAHSIHEERVMSIGRMDLNLLKVFEAVYEDRNLLLAGKRLNLTQSAVSHALKRLRELWATSSSCAPARAWCRPAAPRPWRRGCGRAAPDRGHAGRRSLRAGHVRAALRHRGQRPRDRGDRGAPVARAAGGGAAHRPRHPPSTRLDLAEQIDLGRIDLAIGIFSQVPQRLNSRTLLSQGEAILMRKGTPPRAASSRCGPGEVPAGHACRSAGQRKARWAASSSNAGSRGSRRCSTAMRWKMRSPPRRRRRPSLRITVPHALAIPALLRDTSMLSIVPASLAVALAKGEGLVRRKPPYEARTSTLRAVWHGRDEHDVGHAWLREMVAKAAQAV
jgi:DNA-binding transcriptional LysR family regulator